MTKFFLFQGKRIKYEIAGNGNAIVLLHGFIESSAIWREFLSGLEQEFRVLAIDLPGHGESEVISDIHSMPLMAEVVNAVMENEGIDRAVVVGHSMGGYVSMAFAELFPARVAGVVMFHSQAAADSEETKNNRQRTIRIVEQNRSGFIKQFIPELFDQRHVKKYSATVRLLIEEASRMKPEAIIAAVTGMRDRNDMREVLGHSMFPFLFISGKRDPRIPLNIIFEQASIPAHAEVLILENVGHMGYIESPEITFQAIRHFAFKCYETTT